MKKRNLRPQQVAPVARVTNTTSDQQGLVTPLSFGWVGSVLIPFAGEDAE